ncbi:prolipoprotein diacylglyceryl transferase [bacterium]|nr:prolipoprotein diacylglyceryl transferase [bacterium]
MYPEFLTIGSFVIYWYGVMVAIGVFISSLIFQKLARQNNYTQDTISNIIFFSVLWGIIGGRVLHILVHFHYYYRNLLEIVSIRNGGLAAEGAIISAIIFLFLYSKIKNFNLRKTLDLISVPVPLAQALGRVGCFLNGCCWGKPSELPWAVKFPHLLTKVHPTQLYYTVCHLFLFALLLCLNKRKLKEGTVFSAYIMGFAFIRYTIDKFRGDLLETSLGLYPTQIIAIFLFTAGLFWFLSITKDDPELTTLEENLLDKDFLPNDKDEEKREDDNT